MKIRLYSTGTLFAYEAMNSFTSSSFSSKKILYGIITVCVLASIACLPVEGTKVSANVTVGGLTFKLSLNSSEFVGELNITRSDFPSDFIFGVGTSAAQIEGSSKEGGRGPSIWDHYVERNPGQIQNSNMFSAAIDSYKRYKEDIKILKDLGVNSYRFSISWSRILPNGSLSGGINQEGIDHYNSMIDELIRNGIEPFVTLLHFDLPQALEEKYGGYLNRTFVNDFKDYSELCFKTFGDRVKNWFTINEPNIPAVYGYELGIAPPGRCSFQKPFCVFGLPPPAGLCFVSAGPCTSGGNSSTEPYIAAHNLILAHASAVKLYREKYRAQQKGEIGVVLVSEYYVPYSESPEDEAATARQFDFQLGWFLEPFVYGDYPKSMKELVKERLPTFSAQEKTMIKGSLDFVGINYYKSYYVKNKQPSSTEEPRYSLDIAADKIEVDKDGVSLGLDNGHWPKGLEKLMLYIKEKYQNPKIYISENGTPEQRNDDDSLAARTNDPYRISFLVRHLYRLHKAITSGVNIKGYFYWTLFDDFEWGMGLHERYGLYYIDFNDDFKRIPNLSSKWFQAFLRSNQTQANQGLRLLY